ncbi:MAG TPA: phosphoribosyltransferase [Thermoanaerobaculia bacterium]|nr:phosphoribosyltransferase [Thermoanaerobaculia bacterium]
MHFRDRRHAGQVLTESLLHYAGRDDVIVLALPRGGVPVGFEVTKKLGAPLDVFIVRKLGSPGHEELAMGAIASGGILVLNDDVVQSLRVSRQEIEQAAARELLELERRERLFRGDRAAPNLEGRVVILVDDGLATGSTMRAAVAAVRTQKPSRIVVAVPTGAPETCEEFRQDVDEVVCPSTPDYFRAVGMWYDDFTQTEDREVRSILEAAGAGTKIDV